MDATVIHEPDLILESQTRSSAGSFWCLEVQPSATDRSNDGSAAEPDFLQS